MGLQAAFWETDRFRENLALAALAASHSSEDKAIRLHGTIPADRFGKPEEFAAFATLLCNTQSGTNKAIFQKWG